MVKQKAARWLWQMPGSKKLYILLLAAVQMLHGFSGVLYALLLREIVDGAVDGDTERFWRNVLLTVLLVAVQLALRAVIRRMTESAKSSLENLFKRRLLENILRRDYAAVSSVHSGEWLNRLTNDTVVVANGCVEILPGLAGMLVKILGALVMILALQPRLALILLPVGALILLITYLFRRELKRLHKDVQEKDGRLRVFLQERLGSLLVLRSYAAEEQTEREADEKMADHRAARMRKNFFSNICNIGFGAAVNGMYLLGVCYCGYGILIGTISYGTLTAVTQLISQIQTPMANITGYLPRFYAMIASAERLMEIEELPEEPKETRDLASVSAFYENDFRSVELEHAEFTYSPVGDGAPATDKENMPVVLSDVSLSIRKGEFTAFTGLSGSGKTTILKLILCMYPLDAGARFMLDRSGERIPLTREWRRLFAYVPQGNYLMNGTIREIVCFSDRSDAHDEERLRRALRIACAEDFVRQLDAGADTRLGERGAGLSEGQMQRIAVARAIYADSPILLLDEATSALDEATEVKLLENLRTMTDKTIVIVTHRRPALSICDQRIDISGMVVAEDASGTAPETEAP